MYLTLFFNFSVVDRLSEYTHECTQSGWIRAHAETMYPLKVRNKDRGVEQVVQCARRGESWEWGFLGVE